VKGSRDLLFEIWDPLQSISRKSLNLETLNLASICTARCTNVKIKKIRLKGVGKGSRDLLLKLCDPSISRQSIFEARNFKFGTSIDYSTPLTKKCKIKSKGARKGSRDLFLKMLDPLHISGTREARNLKFGMHIAHEGR